MDDFDKTESSAFLYGERTIGYVVRPGRGRCLKIVVKGPGEVEVRVPARTPLKAVQSFVAKQAEWIVRTMEKQARKPRPAPLKYVTGETLFYLGKPCRLEVVHSVWKRVTREDGVLRVALSDETNRVRVKALVEEWFRGQAEVALASALAEALEKYGNRIRHAHVPLVVRSDAHPKGLRLTVRAMKTRWGSCSKDGHITLSSELIHAPRRLIDYVILHELCHLVHLDHSPAYYFQLAQCLPDWDQRRRDLEARSWQQVRAAT